MVSVQDIILLFTKYPLAGKSKTRLIPSLGPRGAAELQREMTSKITRLLSNFSRLHSCYLEIHHDGGNHQLMQEWLGTSLSYTPQYQGSLGKRMAYAIAAHLGSHRSIILLGSDCPDIDDNIITSAFSGLKQHNTVLGPAFDGGYYLIGVQGSISKRSLHYLFENIDWGEENVFSQTLSRIKKLQLSCHVLKKLHDIDTPEDLKYLDNYPHAQ